MNFQPAKTEFSEAEHDEIRRDVQEQLKADKTLSQAEISRQADMTPSTLNEYLRGSYKGKNDGPAVSLSKWLSARRSAADLRAREPVIPAFQPLQTSKLLWGLMDKARISGDIISVISPPGLSKTTTALQYSASTPRAWYVVIDETLHGLQPMLLDILAAMGRKNVTGSPAMLRKMIVDMLLEAPGVLIIDEADLLSQKSLNEVRAINDATERRGQPIGIVLLSNPDMEEKIGTASENARYARIASRVGHRRVLLAPEQQDVTDCAWAWANANGEHLTKDMLDLCQAIAAKAGGLRNLSKTFKNALGVTIATGETLTADHLKGAFHQLKGIWL